MQLPQFQAHAALEERHWWFCARRHIVRELVHAVLPPSKECQVVDVGCGTGGMTAFMSREYTCMGIDPSDDAIRFATSRFPENTFIHGTAPADAREQIGKADLVLLLEVLEHVKEDRAFVQELIGAMGPGALLLIAAPADMSLWSPHDAGFGHERRYDEEGFRHTWEGAPVHELLVSHFNSRMYPLAKAARMLARLRGKSWGPGDTDLALPMAPVNTLLETIFKGEAARLLNVLCQHKKPYRRGVSLLALLQKQA